MGVLQKLEVNLTPRTGFRLGQRDVTGVPSCGSTSSSISKNIARAKYRIPRFSAVLSKSYGWRPPARREPPSTACPRGGLATAAN